MDDDGPSPWEVLLEIIARYGLCGSCHFAPDMDSHRPGEAWTCPRCGFVSTGDPEAWGPTSRSLDPIGVEEPCFGVETFIEDDLDEDSLWEPEFPWARTR